METSLPAPSGIIDAHHHYVDGRHYPACADFPFALLAAMDRQGWRMTCLSGLGPHFRNEGDDAVARAVARHPDRLIGLGRLDPDRGGPDQVRRLAGRGMRGLKVIRTLRRYDDDAYLPFYHEAQACGMPILFHTGFLGGEPEGGPEDVSSDRYRPMTLDRIARLFPRLILIAAHMGTVMWFQEALAVMTHPNVYGDTSGGPSSLPADFYRQPQHAAIRWEKVLFGSDSLPDDAHIPFQNLQRLLRDLAVPDAVREGVFGGTAAKIFKVERS